MIQRLRRASDQDADILLAFQREAYAHNRELLGVEPLPLRADYHEIIATKECWLSETGTRVDGALIIEVENEALLIWSIAVSPRMQGTGLGGQMLKFAEKRAHELGLKQITLYTGQKLGRNINWYTHHGFRIARLEALSDRNIVHMVKAVN